jgi:nucleoside-diphosphate-sugar epimerase
MNDVLILGCGFLGRVLATQWTQEGRTVWATTRSPERAAEIRSGGCSPVVCDVLDPSSLRGLPEVPLAVHCVGFDRTTSRSMREVYVEGLGHFIDEWTRPGRNNPRFIHVSSTSVYGQGDGCWVDEEAPTEPEDESGRVVLEAERLLRARLPEALILRFAGLYGPGRLLRKASLLANEPLTGNPDRWLNLIHVVDGATAIRAAAQRGRPGQVINICDDHPVRRRDFFSRLAEILGALPPRFAPGSSARIDRADRRVLNRRMHQELGVVLRYPSYQEGLSASWPDPAPVAQKSPLDKSTLYHPPQQPRE